MSWRAWAVAGSAPELCSGRDRGGGGTILFTVPTLVPGEQLLGRGMATAPVPPSVPADGRRRIFLVHLPTLAVGERATRP